MSETSRPFVTGLVDWDHSRIPAGPFSVPTHIHHFFQLDILLEGNLEVTIEDDGEPIFCRRGDALLIPPLLRHSYRSPAGFAQASFKFDLAPRYWLIFSDRLRQSRLTETLLDQVEVGCRGYSDEEALSQPRLFAVLSLCLIEMVGKSEQKTLGPSNLDAFRERLWPLLEKIAADPYASWTVAGIVQHCHLQVDYFTRCFQRVLGKPPRAHLQAARIQGSAADLLWHSEWSIDQIAEKAGYASVHAFGRSFKAVFGMGPAAYRKSSTRW